MWERNKTSETQAVGRSHCIWQRKLRRIVKVSVSRSSQPTVGLLAVLASYLSLSCAHSFSVQWADYYWYFWWAQFQFYLSGFDQRMSVPHHQLPRLHRGDNTKCKTVSNPVWVFNFILPYHNFYVLAELVHNLSMHPPGNPPVYMYLESRKRVLDQARLPRCCCVPRSVQLLWWVRCYNHRQKQRPKL